VKERLTGAIILVAVLVLLVPELLTGPESYTPAKPAGAEGAQLRSYTIDLQEDAANRQLSPPTSAAEQPASGATPEPEAESPPVANVSPPVGFTEKDTSTTYPATSPSGSASTIASGHRKIRPKIGDFDRSVTSSTGLCTYLHKSVTHQCFF